MWRSDILGCGQKPSSATVSPRPPTNPLTAAVRRCVFDRIVPSAADLWIGVIRRDDPAAPAGAGGRDTGFHPAALLPERQERAAQNRASTIEALQNSGMDKLDIPAFLRKQAD